MGDFDLVMGQALMSNACWVLSRGVYCVDCH